MRHVRLLVLIFWPALPAAESRINAGDACEPEIQSSVLSSAVLLQQKKFKKKPVPVTSTPDSSPNGDTETVDVSLHKLASDAVTASIATTEHERTDPASQTAAYGGAAPKTTKGHSTLPASSAAATLDEASSKLPKAGRTGSVNHAQDKSARASTGMTMNGTKNVSFYASASSAEPSIEMIKIESVVSASQATAKVVGAATEMGKNRRKESAPRAAASFVGASFEKMGNFMIPWSCGSEGGWNNLGWTAITCNVLLFMVKCLLPAAVEPEDVQNKVARSGPMFFGIACQFVITPACGAIIVWLAQLPLPVGLPLIIITSCPGGTFSNLFCQVFNGDLALSVAMTGASTVVGMGMLPLNIYVYTRLIYSQEVLTSCEWYGIMLSLFMVLAGLCTGLVLRMTFPKPEWRELFATMGMACGLTMFVIMLLVSSENGRGTPVWQKPWGLYGAVLTPVVLATATTMFASSTHLMDLSPPERVAVVFEAVYQNGALGAAVMMSTLSTQGSVAAEAAGVIVCYQVFQSLVLIVFGVTAHYSEWTLANPNEVPLNEALFGDFQCSKHGADADSADSGQ